MLDKLLKYSFILTLTACVLLFPDITAPAIRSGVNLCLTRVIPAIFPFLVLSGMISNSSAGYIAEDICEPIVRRFFKLPKCAATALFSGLLCGFPVGAKTAAELYRSKRLSKSQAEYLLMFCNNTGPSFVIGAVGIDIFSSSALGISLYFIQLFAALICGLILSPIARHESEENFYEAPRAKTPRFSILLCSSVLSGVKSCTSICGFVIFFSFIVGLIEKPVMSLSGDSALFSVICGLFELTRGIYSLEGVKTSLALIIAAGLIGWSGFSVHFQTSAMLSGTGLSLRRCIIGKMLTAAISVVLSIIFTLFAL